MNAWAILMAGGSGTRFWPVSRRDFPKQFLPLFGPNANQLQRSGDWGRPSYRSRKKMGSLGGKKTLLEQTFERLRQVVPSKRIMVFVSHDKVALTRKLLKLPAKQVIGEPVGRNTAPCAVWAASLVMRKDPSAVLGIFPADHYIRDEKVFVRSVRMAYSAASKKGLPVTLGVRPDSPHTGYGYLEMGARVAKDIFYLKRFHEKPTIPLAKRYVASGRFLWNAGIFIWRADRLLETARKFQPEIFRIASRVATTSLSAAAVKKLFSSSPNISIDYGLMEKIPGQILTIPVSMGWNDVGGWSALWKLFPKDKNRNVAIGKTLLVDASGNFVWSRNRLIAAIGLHDYAVVETDDAVLICPMDQTEEIRRIVSELKLARQKQYL